MNTQNAKSADKRRILIFTLIALALALTATVLRLVCLLSFYDKIGYYQRGAIVPIISNVFYALSLVFFAFAARFLLKPATCEEALKKPAKLAAILPLGATIFYLCDHIMIGGASHAWYDVLLLICGVISVVFFASLVFSSQPSTLTALTGVGCIIWFAAAAMKSYLDFFVPMNSPDKLFFQLGAVGAMLLVFAELRAIYRMPMPRVYLFGFFTGIFAICVSAIPSLVAYSCDVFASYTLADEDIVMLALAIYGAVRLFTQNYTKAEVAPVTDAKESEE